MQVFFLLIIEASFGNGNGKNKMMQIADLVEPVH
jgi:hypothetical protein